MIFKTLSFLDLKFWFRIRTLPANQKILIQHSFQEIFGKYIFTLFLPGPRTYLVPGMTDCGVSLHCYGESQVDGAGHGDLSQRQNHTHQAQVAAVGQQARRVQYLILESFTLGKSTKYIPQFF